MIDVKKLKKGDKYSFDNIFKFIFVILDLQMVNCYKLSGVFILQELKKTYIDDKITKKEMREE